MNLWGTKWSVQFQFYVFKDERKLFPQLVQDKLGYVWLTNIHSWNLFGVGSKFKPIYHFHFSKASTSLCHTSRGSDMKVIGRRVSLGGTLTKALRPTGRRSTGRDKCSLTARSEGLIYQRLRSHFHRLGSCAGKTDEQIDWNHRHERPEMNVLLCKYLASFSSLRGRRKRIISEGKESGWRVVIFFLQGCGKDIKHIVIIIFCVVALEHC